MTLFVDTIRPAVRGLFCMLIGSLIVASAPVAGAEWTVTGGYLMPTQDDRDIEMSTLEVSRAWPMTDHFSLSLGGGVLHTVGDRGDPPLGVDSDSTTTGMLFGGAAHYRVPLTDRLSLVGDASLHMTWLPDQAFPAGGTGVNALLRGAGGISYAVGTKTSIEAGYQRAHLSNASGVSPQNPMWNGQGAFLRIRYTPSVAED